MLYNSSNAISDLLKFAEGKKGKNEINVTNWESSRKKRKNKVLKTRKNIMKKVAQNSKKNIRFQIKIEGSLFEKRFLLQTACL